MVPTEEHLHGIFAFDGCHAWALGEEAGDTGTTPDAQSSVVGSTDGGKTWKAQSFPTGSAKLATMNRVFFTDVNRGYAAGENNGTFSPAAPAPIASATAPVTTAPNFFTTIDGGATWVDIRANLPAATKNTADKEADIEGLTAVGDNVWFAMGNNGVGIIAHSADRGASWTVQKLLAGKTFSSISMFDANNGFATSDDSHLWSTSTGGATWVKGKKTKNNAEGVWASGPLAASIVEEGGTIQYTTDGVALLTATRPSSVGTNDLLDVAFGSALNGVASGELGGNVLRTSDGGKTWTAETANAGNNNFNGVTMAKGTTISFVTGESGAISGNTDPAVGCVAAAQLPANTSPTPKLPAAGSAANLDGPLRIGFVLIVLLGLGVGSRAVAERARRRD